MSPAEIIKRALSIVPQILEGESIRDYESRITAWTVGRPRVEWAAASLTFAALQLSALDTAAVQPVEPDKRTFDRTEYQRRYMANRREASKSAS